MYQSFRSDAERSAWIMANADFWSVVRFRNRRYGRVECPSHELAKLLAQALVKEIPDARFMIYAVVGQQSTYVETIQARSVEYDKRTGVVAESPSTDQ